MDEVDGGVAQGEELMGFAALGLGPPLCAALSALGYEEPTPIQVAAIGPVLRGADVLGMAATGTGKTAAFGLPLVERCPPTCSPGRPWALVLVPTRELALQVATALQKYGRGTPLTVAAVVGGQPMAAQTRTLQRGAQIVVATPGRALDHLGRGSLDLSEVGVVVLDEADEMLDMGFAEDLDALLSATPEGRQTVLFSATLPHRILDIASRHLREPVRIDIERPAPVEGEAPRVSQSVIRVPGPYKLTALARLLELESPGAAIVFCRSRLEVEEVTEALAARGWQADALHGGMTQDRRDRVMRRLRAGEARVLVATDVAARGLDIDHLTHVINFDVPWEVASYVHRIGRVGRAGREGAAITLAEPREARHLFQIERQLGRPLDVRRAPAAGEVLALQLGALAQELGAAAQEPGLDPFRAIAVQLIEERDLMDVAAAAIRMAWQARHPVFDDAEIPDLQSRPARPARPGHPEGRPPERGPRGPEFARAARLYVGLGRGAGVRPQDLVGALLHETSLDPSEVGQVRIHERFSLVEVPEERVEHLLAALRGKTLRGRKAGWRLDRGTPS
jgi:ATP-dependent RNA helicase DeaD